MDRKVVMVLLQTKERLRSGNEQKKEDSFTTFAWVGSGRRRLWGIDGGVLDGLCNRGGGGGSLGSQKRASACNRID